MTTTAALTAANAARWSRARLTRAAEFTPVARRLVATAAKARYQTIEARTRVPWFIVAVIHEREASQRWDKQLGQGDPLAQVSRRVPKGRGPFKTFEEGAIDALVKCAPYAARWTDWTPGGAMTLLEQYNGLGYAARGQPSPYIWSGTDQYRSGNYIADHVYSATTVDAQLGCAGLLLAMQAIDPSVQFGTPSNVVVLRPANKPAQTVAPIPNAAPSIAHPAAGSVGAALSRFFASIFKRAA